MAVKTEIFVADKNILIAPELAFTFGVQVGNTGVSANSNGKKIVKAGTPLYQSQDVLMNRQTVLTISAGGVDATVAGILLHDVDVTDGTQNGTLVYRGYVDYLKLDDDVQTLVTAALTAGKYNPTIGWRVTFIKGAK